MNILKTNRFYKFSILVFIFLIIGIPINSLENFILLIITLPIIVYSKINKNLKYNKVILFFLIFMIIKFIFPPLHIHEGNNLVLLNSNTHDYYKKNLPKEVFSFFKNKYSSFYSNSSCKIEDRRNCWENYYIKNSLKSNSEITIYAKSSDWSLSKPKYSRILNDIRFTNLKTARIEVINDTDFNFYWPSQFDVVRENIPFFTMIEIPKKLLGSSLCWKGYTFWENDTQKYDKKFNPNLECSTISSENINKKIYGASFGGTVSMERLNELYTDKFAKINDRELKQFLNDNELILTLDKHLYLKTIDILKFIITILLISYLLFKFFIFNNKLILFSIAYSSLFILVAFIVHEDLFYGFTVYTGGNDGILYSSYASKMFYSLQNFDFYEFLRGGEDIFYYMPGLRYFLVFNKIFFGDSMYGYLIVAFFYPLIIYQILELLIGKNFAIIITAISFLTRAFEGYALSTYKMLEHIKDGDAEPLAIILLLFCLFMFLKKFIKNYSENYTSIFYFTFGFLLFVVTAVRPNYLPATFCLTIYMSLYLFLIEKNLKYSFYTLLGYVFLFLLPIHNYYFGKELYFFTKAGVKLYSYISLETWFAFVIDILTFDLSDITNKYSKIFKQLNIWIKPYEVHYIITFLIVLLITVLKNKPYIKFICIITLLQHLICLYILPHGRYAYLAWTMTFIINLYFINIILIYFKNWKISK